MILIEKCLELCTVDPEVGSLYSNSEIKKYPHDKGYLLGYESLHISIKHNSTYNDWDIHIDDRDRNTVAVVYHLKHFEQILQIAKSILLSYGTIK